VETPAAVAVKPVKSAEPVKATPPAQPQKPKQAKPTPPAKPKPAEVAAVQPKKDLPTGTVTIHAPDDVKIFLDGKLVGSGNLRKKLPAGQHTVTVTLGESRTGEDFTLAPGGTYTYEVTPYQQ
jgi:hypothetical protein